MPSYLVTGGSGQLGKCFQAVAKEFSEIQLYFVSRSEVDITQKKMIDSFYKKYPFDGIINCAAYTSVDKAEIEEENALRINCDGLQVLIDFAENKNLSIIHFSSDYVFNGHSTNHYHELAKTNPLGVYGHSKLQGENFLSKSSCKNVTIRTSWLFSPYGKNFVKTIARLGKEKKNLKVVNNQWGRPTYGMDLAKTILKLIYNNSIFTFPILHYANKGICSWEKFAEAIVNELKLNVEVNGIPDSAYPTLAERPKYSILDTQCIEKELNIKIPSWQNSLKKCIESLKNEGSL
tara:strand:- start:5916 stop:6788 length:873 start_codon:yes stop_codon:yes gene_type:complete